MVRGLILGAALLALPAHGMAESRFLTSKVLEHVQAATAACAGHVADGQDMAVLEARGFDRDLRDWVWDTRMHGLDEKLAVTASAESGKCKVSISHATRADSKRLNEEMAASFVRLGFADGGQSSKRSLTRGDLALRLDGHLHKLSDVQSASVTVSTR